MYKMGLEKAEEGQDGEHMYTHGWSMWMYGKTTTIFVK